MPPPLFPDQTKRRLDGSAYPTLENFHHKSTNCSNLIIFGPLSILSTPPNPSYAESRTPSVVMRKAVSIGFLVQIVTQFTSEKLGGNSKSDCMSTLIKNQKIHSSLSTLKKKNTPVEVAQQPYCIWRIHIVRE